MENNQKLKHICENCGQTEILTSNEAFEQGWDYPPFMGTFGVVSPRTCPDCEMSTTLWWELQMTKTPVDALSERHTQTLQRILGEPASIMPD